MATQQPTQESSQSTHPAATMRKILRYDDDLLDHTFRSSHSDSASDTTMTFASPSFTVHKLKSGEWDSYQLIPADIPLSAYRAQAQSNSLAASRAMTHAPLSVQYPFDHPYRNIPVLPPLDSPQYDTNLINPVPIDTTILAYSSKLVPNSNKAWDGEQRLTDDKGWEAARAHGPAFIPEIRYPGPGRRSKKDRLGSVNTRWGALPPTGDGQRAYVGVFQLEENALDEFFAVQKEERPSQSEIRQAKYEALGRARMGMPKVGSMTVRQ